MRDASKEPHVAKTLPQDVCDYADKSTAKKVALNYDEVDQLTIA